MWRCNSFQEATLAASSSHSHETHTTTQRSPHWNVNIAHGNWGYIQPHTFYVSCRYLAKNYPDRCVFGDILAFVDNAKKPYEKMKLVSLTQSSVSCLSLLVSKNVGSRKVQFGWATNTLLRYQMCNAVRITKSVLASWRMWEKVERDVALMVHLVSFSPRDLLKLFWKHAYEEFYKFSFFALMSYMNPSWGLANRKGWTIKSNVDATMFGWRTKLTNSNLPTECQCFFFWWKPSLFGLVFERLHVYECSTETTQARLVFAGECAEVSGWIPESAWCDSWLPNNNYITPEVWETDEQARWMKHDENIWNHMCWWTLKKMFLEVKHGWLGFQLARCRLYRIYYRRDKFQWRGPPLRTLLKLICPLQRLQMDANDLYWMKKSELVFRLKCVVLFFSSWNVIFFN